MLSTSKRPLLALARVRDDVRRASVGYVRLAEAASILGLPDEQIVVNVQGDEPLIPPAAIDQLAEALTASSADMATLASPLNSPDDMLNANVVKVVTDARSEALYFSRAAIPFNRDKVKQDSETRCSISVSMPTAPISYMLIKRGMRPHLRR